MSTSTALDNLATWTVDLADDVLFQELDGEAVLLSIRTGEYFGLNRTGAHVWQSLAGGQSLAEAFESLTLMYDVDDTVVADDVVGFLRTLADMGLLTIERDVS